VLITYDQRLISEAHTLGLRDDSHMLYLQQARKRVRLGLTTCDEAD
jgi:hypothetical protein